MKRWFPFAAVAVLLVAAGHARADAGPKIADKALYLPVGLSVGGAFHHENKGLTLGAEASLAHWREGWWMGLYSDILHDFGNERTRLSIGPEFGYGFFGIDGGLLTQLGDDKLYTGYQVRGLLTMSVIALYGRGGYLPSHPTEQGFAEFGVLFKIPILLWEDRPPFGRYHEPRELPPPAPSPAAPDPPHEPIESAPAPPPSYAQPPPGG